MFRVLLHSICLTQLVLSQSFTHFAWLDSDNRILANWRVDDTKQEIAFEIVGRTTGWMAIGFSSNGAMTGADIIIMWVDEQGQAQLIDAHAVTNGRPLKDAQQNLELESMSRNDSHITARFHRALNTCDNDDWKITEDTVRLIWAFNDQLPTSFETIAKHETSNRGSRSMHLLYEQQNIDFTDVMSKIPNIESSDLVISNGPVPSSHHTLYWCQIFSLPKQNLKHLVGYDVIINPPTNRKFVHHFLLYRCAPELASMVGRGAPCYPGQKGAPPGADAAESQAENPMAMCPMVLAAWAYGSDGFIFPNDTGLPLFADEGESVYMLEMHYDNQDFVPNVIDNSGVRLYYTSQLRPIQTAHLILGQSSQPNSLIIPPHETSFKSIGYCPSGCTLDLDPRGMDIFGGFLHTHLIGTAARIRHIRNGIELKPIMQDDHYDFNYQSMTAFKPVTVLPGDELIVECIYNSISRDNKTTVGGPSTTDEMCYAFMYAKYINSNDTGGAACLSTPDISNFIKSFGAAAIEEVHHYKTNVIIADAQGRNQTIDIIDFMNSGAVDWTKKQHNIPNDVILEKSLRDESAFIFCNLNMGKGTQMFRAPGPPEIRVPYVEPDVCDLTSSRSARQGAGNDAVSVCMSKLLLVASVFIKTILL